MSTAIFASCRCGWTGPLAAMFEHVQQFHGKMQALFDRLNEEQKEKPEWHLN